MEKKKSPPLPALKLKFFYSLPKAMSSEPLPKKKKKTADASIIPRRASTKVKKNGSFRSRSPKVSCIGNVTNKANNNNKKKKDEKKNKRVLILKILTVFKNKGAKTANPYAESSYSPPEAVYEKSAPKLGYAKKLSGHRRGLISGFNWRVHDSSVLGTDRRTTSLSNKGKEKRNCDVVVEKIVLVPKKEINLWKKRMVAPPPPLRV